MKEEEKCQSIRRVKDKKKTNMKKKTKKNEEEASARWRWSCGDEEKVKATNVFCVVWNAEEYVWKTKTYQQQAVHNRT